MSEPVHLALLPPRNGLLFLGAIVLGPFSLAALACWPPGGWPPLVLVTVVAGLVLILLAVDCSVRRCELREEGLWYRSLLRRGLFPYRELVVVEFRTVHPKNEAPHVRLTLHGVHRRIQLRQREEAVSETCQWLDRHGEAFVLIDWDRQTATRCGTSTSPPAGCEQAAQRIARRIAMGAYIRAAGGIVALGGAVAMAWSGSNAGNRYLTVFLALTATVLIAVWVSRVARMAERLRSPETWYRRHLSPR